MRTFAIIVSCLLMGAAAADAQEEGGRRRGRGVMGGNMMARMAGPLLVAAADTNHDGEVTAEEWSAFMKMAESGKDGAIDTAGIKRQMFTNLLDENKNGKLEVSDFDAMFNRMDKDGDGALSQEEMPQQRRRGRGARGGEGRGGRGGAGGAGGRAGGGGDGGFRTQDDDTKAGGDAKKDDDAAGEGQRPRRQRQQPQGNRYQGMAHTSVLRMADSDSSGDITAEEWTGFKSALAAEGGAVPASSIDTLVAGPDTEGSEGEGRRRRGGMSLGSMFDMALGGRDGEAVTAERLTSIHTAMDANGDGVLEKEEINPQRQRRRRGGDEGDGKGPVF